MADTTIIASAEAANSGAALTTRVTAGAHVLVADEPAALGGNGEGPAPGDYLCMALASCKAITLRMYAQRKKWAVGAITVQVNLVKGDPAVAGSNTFYCTLHFSGSLDAHQVKRLLEIAKVCPIDRLLRKPSEIVTTIV